MQSETAISRELMGKIVDEVFDGAIEDASVIEEIYAVIKREEAALSAAEPVAWRYRYDNVVGWSYSDTKHPRSDLEQEALYAVPPSPSVAVKASPDALEQFTAYFVKNYPGPNTIIFDPKWHAPKIFRAAISALSAQVQEVAQSKQLDLNITKEWLEKRAGLEGDHEIGAGRRKLTASVDPTPEELAELYRLAHRIPEGWQLAPIEPTQEMCEAPPSLPAIHAIDDLPLKKSGWSMGAIVNRKRYLAMLAAAPAKQEGGR